MPPEISDTARPADPTGSPPGPGSFCHSRIATPVSGEQEPGQAASRPEVPDFPGIVGWQPFVLNVGQTCEGCSRSLARGDQGYLGISATGRPGSTLCPQCAEALS